MREIELTRLYVRDSSFSTLRRTIIKLCPRGVFREEDVHDSPRSHARFSRVSPRPRIINDICNGKKESLRSLKMQKVQIRYIYIYVRI